MSTCDPCIHFVESMGLLWEDEGLPRIAGRIFGYLVVQSDACSLDDLAAGLGVSKASISTDARRLEQLGLISRVSRPGDRRDYYAVAGDALIAGLEFRLKAFRRAEQCIIPKGDRASLPQVVQERLDRFQHAQHKIMDALEAVLEELRAQAPVSATPTDPQ